MPAQVWAIPVQASAAPTWKLHHRTRLAEPEAAAVVMAAVVMVRSSIQTRIQAIRRMLALALVRVMALLSTRKAVPGTRHFLALAMEPLSTQKEVPVTAHLEILLAREVEAMPHLETRSVPGGVEATQELVELELVPPRRQMEMVEMVLDLGMVELAEPNSETVLAELNSEMELAELAVRGLDSAAAAAVVLAEAVFKNQDIAREQLSTRLSN